MAVAMLLVGSLAHVHAAELPRGNVAFRYRGEKVEQQGAAHDAFAHTARLRLGKQGVLSRQIG